jgi:FMN phosphatase YigB (HAD superfamily)
MSKPKLILFDFGGVLVDYSKSFETASREQNLPIEYIDSTFDNNNDPITKGEITPQDIYRLAVRESGIEADLNYDFVDSWARDYDVIEASYNFLIDLSIKYPIGILSNTYKGLLDKSIALNKIPNVEYNYIFESCNIGYKKPEIEIYKYVEEKTGLKSSNILFIDDREDFISGANNLGWETFLFDSLNPIMSVEQIQKKYKL